MGKKLKKSLKPDTPATVYFEVAPDTHDPARMARWRSLPEDRKPIVTRRAALAVVPKALNALKLDGELHELVGGYEGETNPGLAIHVTNGGRAVELAKFLGYAFQQQSMIVSSDCPQPNLSLCDLVAIELPGGFTRQQVATLYDQLWRITREGRSIVEGHNTRFNQMRILNLNLKGSEDLAGRIESAVRYRVSRSKVWAALIRKDTYHTLEAMVPDLISSKRGDHLRWKAASILKTAFEIELRSDRRGRG
jgi:hypothetical protein